MPETKSKLVFATNNQHKLEEIRRIAGGRLQILSLADIGCHDDIPETADTIAGNALIKARWVKERYGHDCFADDTGLMVDALGGEPGVHSARFAGQQRSADDNTALLLRRLEGVPEGERTARFCTVIALVRDCDGTHTFEGTVEGRIDTERHGTGGFGYDPVFIPDETGISFALMSADAKNAISHRGRATRQLLRYLGIPAQDTPDNENTTL